MKSLRKTRRSRIGSIKPGKTAGSLLLVVGFLLLAAAMIWVASREDRSRSAADGNSATSVTQGAPETEQEPGQETAPESGLKFSLETETDLKLDEAVPEPELFHTPIQLKVENRAMNPQDASGRIRCLDAEGRDLGAGSGSIISSDGIVLTNHHVVQAGTRLIFERIDPNSGAIIQHPVQWVMAYSETLDLALVRIEGKNLPALPLGSSRTLQPMQPLTIIGTPKGYQETMNSLIPTVVSRITMDEYGLEVIQCSAGATNGNSGGPVVNEQNEVVAILSSGYNGTSIHNLIPSSHVTQLLFSDVHVTPGQVVAGKSLIGMEGVTSRADVNGNMKDVAYQVIRQPDPDGVRYATYGDGSRNLVARQVAAASGTAVQYFATGHYAMHDIFEVDTLGWMSEDWTVHAGLQYTSPRESYWYGSLKSDTKSRSGSVIPADGPGIRVAAETGQVEFMDYRSDAPGLNGPCMILNKNTRNLYVIEYRNDQADGACFQYDAGKEVAWFYDERNGKILGTALRYSFADGIALKSLYRDGKEGEWKVVDLASLPRFELEERDGKTVLRDLSGSGVRFERMSDGSYGMACDQFEASMDAYGGFSGRSIGTGGVSLRSDGEAWRFGMAGREYLSAWILPEGMRLGEALADANGFSGSITGSGAGLDMSGILYVGQIVENEMTGRGALARYTDQSLYLGLVENGLPKGVGSLMSGNWHARHGLWDGYRLVRPFAAEYLSLP